MSKPRILITGFGPFPGAPVNPTQALVQRLAMLRRPAFADVQRIAHVFPVTYSAVDRELPQLLAQHQPDALLMFGLASRTPFVRIETRARNAVTMLWPDADHTRVRQASITRGANAIGFGPHTARLLRAAFGPASMPGSHAMPAVISAIICPGAALRPLGRRTALALPPSSTSRCWHATRLRTG
jgi:pyrrolidone-carboxylate peptidase